MVACSALARVRAEHNLTLDPIAHKLAVPASNARKALVDSLQTTRVVLSLLGIIISKMRSITFAFTALTLASSISALSLPSQEYFGLAPQLTQDASNPCTLADSPSVNASAQLSSWLECAINSFYPFPANTDWETGHRNSFSQSLLFTFNNTHYDFPGSLRLYKSFNATLGLAFAPFKHGFINTLGIPDADGGKGGFVYMIGWAGGFQQRAKRDMWFTNAAFARVVVEDGARKIAEFRESSNIPNSAAIPEPVEWTCRVEQEEELGEGR
ncbi:hypothetical protein ACN47E_005572 [Coniothyrium glycines]